MKLRGTESIARDVEVSDEDVVHAALRVLAKQAVGREDAKIDMMGVWLVPCPGLHPDAVDDLREATPMERSALDVLQMLLHNMRRLPAKKEGTA